MGLSKRKWTDEAILEDAKKYKTRYEWKKHSNGYQAAKRYGLLEQACFHMRGVYLEWTEEAILEDAKKYKTRTEWDKHSSGYQAATKRKLLNKACAHMKEVKRKPWTKEEILEDAKKYNTRLEWQKKSSKAYNAALRQGLLDTACAHMKEVKRKPWTKEEILEDAKKYKTRIEWHKNSKGYKAARRKGWLEIACAHMVRSNNASSPEWELMNKIKELYPKAHTLKDRKATVYQKPHIKGFHIDIYIPELRKGIEFDGKYWHSIDGLKRSREHWPKEDLANYHKLKDEYFAKKGIQILHIKEEDWLKDQEKCLKKVKKFLGVKNEQSQ